jgi:hypothetical protein
MPKKGKNGSTLLVALIKVTYVHEILTGGYAICYNLKKN